MFLRNFTLIVDDIFSTFEKTEDAIFANKLFFMRVLETISILFNNSDLLALIAVLTELSSSFGVNKSPVRLSISLIQSTAKSNPCAPAG